MSWTGAEGTDRERALATPGKWLDMSYERCTRVPTVPRETAELVILRRREVGGPHGICRHVRRRPAPLPEGPHVHPRLEADSPGEGAVAGAFERSG